MVQDNAAGDMLSALGGLSFSTSAFGFTLAVNTSQSKPMLGSATVPQLDLTFSATTADSGTHSIFLYASDTGFTGSQSQLLAIGGTNSGDSGTVTGRAWGGTSNTALQFSGANLLSNTGSFAGPAYAGTTTNSLVPTTDPYSLTIGVALTRTTAGTSTGDLNFASTPSSNTVPEPSSLLLGALGMAGVASAQTFVTSSLSLGLGASPAPAAHRPTISAVMTAMSHDCCVRLRSFDDSCHPASRCRRSGETS